MGKVKHLLLINKLDPIFFINILNRCDLKVIKTILVQFNVHQIVLNVKGKILVQYFLQVERENNGERRE